MYAPLEYLSQSQQPGRELEERLKIFSTVSSPYGEMTEEEYIHYFFSDFLSERFMESNPKYALLSKTLLYNLPEMMKHVGLTPEDFRTGKYDAMTEMRDVWLEPVLCDRWARNKQVYKPDADFAEVLLSTERVQLFREQVEHLPADSFYIDLEDCHMFNPVIGVFVFVIRHSDKTDFAIYMLAPDNRAFSFYCGAYYDAQGVMDFPMSAITDRDYEIVFPDAPHKKLKYTVSRRSAAIFVLQMICYLTSKEPQVTDDPRTKSTYRPSGKVRNRFSEIQSHEVGIRYGQTIRAYREEIAKSEKEIDDDGTNRQPPETGKTKQERKPAVPHWRCAHWQHYWVGKGRTTREVRWIEPTFIGIGNCSESDVVIHKMKGEKDSLITRQAVEVVSTASGE